MPLALCQTNDETIAAEPWSDGAAQSDPVTMLEQIYQLHHAPLLGYALKLTLGDRTRAEDVVQEAMLRAWRNITLFESADRVRPWLFIVARNIAIDKARSTAARPAECDAELLDLAPTAPDPIDSVVAALDARAVLLSLSPMHRNVLINLYLRDLTLEETAAVLRIPVGTVKSRAHNALRAARRTMKLRRASHPGTAGQGARRSV